jgi:TatD DNase family protein
MIMSETDAPFVAPVPYRGKRNELTYVIEVVKRLAELKGVGEEEMAQITLQNARRLFGV